MLTLALLGDIAKDQDHAANLAVRIADRRSAVVDLDLRTVPPDQQGVIGEADHVVEAKHLPHRILSGFASLFVDDVEDGGQGFADSISLGPASAIHRYLVHEFHTALRVASDHGVTDPAQGG